MKQNNKTETIDKLFIPQRTQPPHIGHISMLEAACQNAKEVVIGICSANKADKKNPYTAPEREQMLRKSLEDRGISNYKFIYVPDFDIDSDWFNYIEEKAGLDENTKFVSGNDWVAELCSERGYQTVHPKDIIEGGMIDISATRLRNMIAEEDLTWKSYAATGTLHYFEQFGGKERIARFYETQYKEAA
jgi:cytidyltransferase-like protein